MYFNEVYFSYTVIKNYKYPWFNTSRMFRVADESVRTFLKTFYKCITYHEILLTLYWDKMSIIVLIKFKTYLKIHIEITRHLIQVPRQPRSTILTSHCIYYIYVYLFILYVHAKYVCNVYLIISIYIFRLVLNFASIIMT